MKKVVLSLVAVMMLAVASAQAQVFKLSLWDSICVPNGDYTVGFELGIGSRTKAVDGVQFGIIYSRADKMRGAQLGIVNKTDEGKGLQWGPVNMAKEMTGLQLGAVNITKGDVTGVQCGWVNYAENATGLQFGIVNYTQTMKGVQLGVVNIIKENKSFLPVFVIFNFCF